MEATYEVPTNQEEVARQTPKRKISDAVPGPPANGHEPEDSTTDDATVTVKMALKERNKDLINLRTAFSVIREVNKSTRVVVSDSKRFVLSFDHRHLMVSEQTNFEDLHKLQKKFMGSVAHSSLTTAEKREFLDKTEEDLNKTVERLQDLVHRQEELINEFKKEQKFIKSYINTLAPNLRYEADCIKERLINWSNIASLVMIDIFALLIAI